MKNIIEYKDYYGTVEISQENDIFCGKVVGVRSLISYKGTDVKGLLEDFHNAVDEYLDKCEKEGVVPERSFKGSFGVRLSPELHMQAALYAMENDITLNRFVIDSIRSALDKKK